MIGLGIGLAICFAAGGRMTMRPIPLWAKVLMAVGGVIWGASLITLIVAIPPSEARCHNAAREAGHRPNARRSASRGIDILRPLRQHRTRSETVVPG